MHANVEYRPSVTTFPLASLLSLPRMTFANAPAFLSFSMMHYLGHPKLSKLRCFNRRYHITRLPLRVRFLLHQALF